MTYEGFRRAYADRLRALAQAAHDEYCRQLYPLIYLCGRKHENGTYAEIGLYRDGAEPEGFAPIMPEHISPAQTVDYNTCILRTRLRNEPIIPALVPEYA